MQFGIMCHFLPGKRAIRDNVSFSEGFYLNTVYYHTFLHTSFSQGLEAQYSSTELRETSKTEKQSFKNLGRRIIRQIFPCKGKVDTTTQLLSFTIRNILHFSTKESQFILRHQCFEIFLSDLSFHDK